MEKGLYLGSHVGMKAPDYYVGSVQEALSYGANTFMFYTGAPQNSFRLPTSTLKIKEGRELIKQAGLDESKIIVHAPYIINIANRENAELYKMSKLNLTRELKRVADFGLSILVLHPGAHVGAGAQSGMDAIVDALDEVLSSDGTNVKIALETMSGKGSEIGATFDEIKYIIDHCQNKDRLGVCVDTCHISDGDYNVSDVEGILDLLDQMIGLNKILCLHINDSKNVKGSHKDRHENIGYGQIGFETLNAFVHNPRLVGIPKLLETPYIEGEPPYKKEIAMLSQSEFVPNWRE